MTEAKEQNFSKWLSPYVNDGLVVLFDPEIAGFKNACDKRISLEPNGVTIDKDYKAYVPSGRKSYMDADFGQMFSEFDCTQQDLTVEFAVSKCGTAYASTWPNDCVFRLNPGSDYESPLSLRFNAMNVGDGGSFACAGAKQFQYYQFNANTASQSVSMVRKRNESMSGPTIVIGYKNGKQVRQDTVSGAILHGSITGVRLFDFDGQNMSAFDGKIYSFRIYNRQLSANEILQNYMIDKERFGI